MKTTFLVLLLVCVSSFASSLLSPRQATLSHGASMNLHPNIEIAPLNYITLEWEPNYDNDEEITVIVFTSDLTLPILQWSPCFSGHTNTCRLPIFYNQQFFTAYNIIP